MLEMNIYMEQTTLAEKKMKENSLPTYSISISVYHEERRHN
jgi:hypothetical protein